MMMMMMMMLKEIIVKTVVWLFLKLNFTGKQKQDLSLRHWCARKL